MAADSKLVLQGDFEAAKTYMLKGSTLIAWKTALTADRVIPGPNLKETATPQGRIFTAQAGGAAAAAGGGSFCSMFERATEGTYLLGGTIADGGNGGAPAVVPNYLVRGPTGDPEEMDGSKLWLKASITMRLSNGVAIPGPTLNSAELTTTTPTAHEFTVAAPTGDIFIEIGRWIADTFLPSGACGLSLVSGCFGAFTIN